MRLTIFENLDAVPDSVDVVAVANVFRVWATAYAVIQSGAEVLLANDPEEAAEVHARHPDWLLVGDWDGVTPQGFDLPCSPTRCREADLRDRTVVLVSSGAVPAIVRLRDHNRIFPFFFGNITAVAQALESSNADEVALVAPAGTDGQRSLENSMCAMFLKNAVEDYPNNHQVLYGHLRNRPAAAMFDDPARTDAPSEDFDACMALDSQETALEVVTSDFGLPALVPIAASTATS